MSNIRSATQTPWYEHIPGNANADMERAMLQSSTSPMEAHPLYPQLMAAIEQAMYGKGERHGGARTPFLEQPWLHYAEMHGRGFLTGQAAKKLEEAASTKTGEAFAQEIRGAIVYLGMTLIYHAIQQHKEAAQDT